LAKITVFYNNKGGVSKTTTLYNVGVYLAEQLGLKTLLIDCDPQCNLTEITLASMESAGTGAIPGTSIYQSLLPRFQGEMSRPDVGNVSLVRSEIYKNLYLLPGDFELSLAEAFFASAVDRSITENIHEKNNYLALRRLFIGLAELHGFDQILVDVGPSSGSLTRMAFLSSDQFLLPTTPDRFCNQAVSVLGKVISAWVRRNKEIVNTFDAFNLEKLEGCPVFLGAVSQNFKSFAGRTKESYAKWETEIAKNIRSTFIDPVNRPLPLGKSIKPSSSYIAKIKDVGPLAPTAQMFGRAIFDLEKQHSEYASSTGQKYYGAVWQTWEDRMSEYRKEMKKIAGAIQNG
jgi:cellulose biosynthesis protein BcsQ